MAAEKKEVKRCVLAYSGGLDTSCILAWLIEEGYEVVAYAADLGGGEKYDDIKAKALKAGAKKAYVVDMRKEFVEEYVWPLIRSGAVYEGRYLLGTSIARPIIAKHQVAIAQKENCQYVAHGCTGKGNDQVRFQLSVSALDPSIKTIAPWRDPKFLARFKGRKDLLKYAAEKGIQVDQTPKASYSEDANLLHRSYESGVLEDPAAPPPANMFKHTKDLEKAAAKPENLRIHFKDGTPVRVENKDDGADKKDALELFEYLNVVAGRHGIGRIDIVESRFVGMKSRGVYETPAGTVLRAAHQDLEGICVDREVMSLRDQLQPQYAKALYNGFWFAPEMEFLNDVMMRAQRFVDGYVDVRLYRGNIVIMGRASPYSRYDEHLASMDEEGDYNPVDAEGFIKINAVRLTGHAALKKRIAKTEPKRAAKFLPKE